MREKQWGLKPWGPRLVKQALGRYAKYRIETILYCGLERADEICNSWGRKTFVTVALGDMQIEASKVMNVTTHRSEAQMRRDYMMRRGNREARGSTERIPVLHHLNATTLRLLNAKCMMLY